ncbi:Rne/Rng family ribonuclease [Bartonella krasnovii]|uniref:Ribonuclease E n=1 Tax=Bartonella krasnovii TaxID=2267275 RepID=A0A5B9D159_9HYPH|nr:ribonuclease E/G [Bartonella krasnovii]QEE12188.1 Rne/Rng family ribonuclease [Bartonella krasnovii]UNF37940.1 Rne/Rng family ribonuclease [Bartonella krasnovii]UNF43042.1 Rne/Rng family ribonuclease [Bartonella krasnovii]UNF44637.1 Rne/Rng family ribonuclease [Bartonella krasnovii]UNF46133.1 Rne/Rng family ribonuclease [Bartonella krasnovii]
MSNKMLIDASHPEETRVVVVHGNKIEELDFESEHKKQLKGNIYLARITRVEPSLQAAFVEYGGNRHGFLTFSEIHPDYYQIPIADRLALLEEEEAAAVGESPADIFEEETTKNKKRSRRTKKNAKNNVIAADVENDIASETVTINHTEEILNADVSYDEIEMVGAEDIREELPTYQRKQGRQYKIQEVIKRRQILLVQVIKEERGNKGAALTTYLSLAGRYSVLMPNTARGGGISRKITNVQDRKRLKEIVKELAVPKGMGVILRTAGANRTKAEIKRDYEYLMRLWDTIRTLTLESTAPCLVHEESNLIKRSIRDLYNKNISEILVSGDQGYREAKDFMRMLMPSHAKVVQPYRDPTPIFARNNIEIQLDKMLQPQVSLKSGGYLVINQTEALVAIDVNSGRSTKEFSVEKTALQTNLEAAEEVARQLRLRDLAGLIVIDFIDMLEERNVRLVEKKLKDCLKNDRARIQVGHISHFGLLEMSRQRIRISVLESTTQPCPHCAGTGSIRSESSIALHVMRSIEEYLLHNSQYNIIVRTPVATALYVLNHKRNILVNLETRFKLNISIEADDSIGTQHLVISKGTIAESISQSSLEDDNKQEIENSVFIKSESIENPPSIETNQKRQRKNHHDEIADHSLSDSHKKEDTLSDDSYRRGRRRGRRGGRRNQDNSFHQVRIPYAEPVGDFSKKALAEIKAAHRKRSGPSAKSSKPEEIKNDTQALELQQQDEATKVDDTRVKPKKRKTLSSRAVENNLSLESDQNIVEQKSLEEKTKSSSAHKIRTKKTDKSLHENEDKAPENTKKSTRRTRKKTSSKETTEIQKTLEKETDMKMEKAVELSPSKIEETINHPVVISSTSNDSPKTARIGWWKRRTLSKN